MAGQHNDKRAMIRYVLYQMHQAWLSLMKLSILNFWKDRICPSRVFQPPPKMIRTRDSDSEFSSSDDSGTEEEEGIEDNGAQYENKDPISA